MNFKDIALLKEEDPLLQEHLAQFSHQLDEYPMPLEIENLIKVFFTSSHPEAKTYKAIRYTKDRELKYRTPDLLQLFENRRLHIVEVKTCVGSIHHAIHRGLSQILEYHTVVKHIFRCQMTLVIAQLWSDKQSHCFTINHDGVEVEVIVIRKSQIQALRCLYSNSSESIDLLR